MEKDFNQDMWNVYSPVDTKFSHLGSQYKKVKSTRAMKFKTLINAFNINDLSDYDEMSISVYSDSMA